jgi:hypothetical protein
MSHFADLRFADQIFFVICGFAVCGFVQSFVEICEFIAKIFGFAICGLGHLRNLRICDSGVSQRIADLRFAKKVCLPTSDCIVCMGTAGPSPAGAPRKNRRSGK